MIRKLCFNQPISKMGNCKSYIDTLKIEIDKYFIVLIDNLTIVHGNMELKKVCIKNITTIKKALDSMEDLDKINTEYMPFITHQINSINIYQFDYKITDFCCVRLSAAKPLFEILLIIY